MCSISHDALYWLRRIDLQPYEINVKFREHRGSLAESMKTEVDVEGLDGLLAHIRKLAEPWPTFPPVTSETVRVSPYGFVTGWHIVTLDGYGVLGFTDSAGEQHGES